MNLSRYLLNSGAHVVCAARSEAKARKLDFFDAVEWVFGDMSQPYAYEGHIDYIIHTASPTDSQYFVDHPVETINDTVLAMNHILNFAKEKSVSGTLSQPTISSFCSHKSVNCRSYSAGYPSGTASPPV